jgi:hypothetical protein
LKKTKPARTPPWLSFDTDTQTYSPNEHANSVKRLFTLMAETGLNDSAMAEFLIEEAVPPIARGDKWTKSIVCRLLADTRVIGTYNHREGVFPSVVERGVFDWAQTSRKLWSSARGNIKRNSKGSDEVAQDFAFLFPDLCHCWCGGSMRIYTKDRTPQAIYIRCMAKDHLPKPSIKWLAKDFEDAVLYALMSKGDFPFYPEVDGEDAAQRTRDLYEAHCRLVSLNDKARSVQLRKLRLKIRDGLVRYIDLILFTQNVVKIVEAYPGEPESVAFARRADGKLCPVIEVFGETFDEFEFDYFPEDGSVKAVGVWKNNPKTKSATDFKGANSIFNFCVERKKALGS